MINKNDARILKEIAKFNEVGQKYDIAFLEFSVYIRLDSGELIKNVFDSDYILLESSEVSE